MPNTRLAVTLGLSVLLTWALPLAHVRAQDDDAARSASARVLFEEGVALADESRWQEAADRFRRALELRSSAVIAYNLASAVQELGRLVEASELYRRVLGDAEAAAELRASATAALHTLEPRLARLSVHVDGQQDGDHVQLDERELLAAELDVSLPIDPGDHVVRVQRAQHAVAEQSVSIAEGQSQQVSLRIEQVAPTPREVAVVAAPPPRASQARTEADKPALTERWWFWAGVGTAAAGVAVVAVLLASSGSSAQAKPEQGDFEPQVLGVEVAP